MPGSAEEKIMNDMIAYVNTVKSQEITFKANTSAIFDR